MNPKPNEVVSSQPRENDQKSAKATQEVTKPKDELSEVDLQKVSAGGSAAAIDWEIKPAI